MMRVMLGFYRITKAQFYDWGGFANSRLVRVTRSERWGLLRRGEMIAERRASAEKPV